MSAGDRRAKATFWLLGASDSLAAQSHRDPDGTGLGWFDQRGVPQVRKQPIAAYGDVEFGHEARGVTSSVFLAHIRFASTGALDLRNTHPFEQHGRLFAHNGVVEELPALEAHLGDALALVQRDTDSERLFALITREVDAHGGDVEAGIAAACEWVAVNLPLLAINLILTTDGELWALRYPEMHQLHILVREPDGPLDHASSLGSQVHSEHGIHRPLVVIASERMDKDRGWRAMRSGELAHIDPELRVSTRTILREPPARPLTLDDLGAQARASQASGAGPAAS